MSVNLVEKYGDKLDMPFTLASFTERAINTDYDFIGAKTVKVLTPTTVELTDYDRTATGDRFGGNKEMQDTEATYTVTQDKSFKVTIDAGNLAQQAMLKKGGKMLKAQIDEQVTPAIDKYRFSVAAKGAIAVKQNLTATSDAYDDVLEINKMLGNKHIPRKGRIFYAGESFYKKIKKELVTTVNANEFNNGVLKEGYVGQLDGVPTIVVPDDYLPENTQAILVHKKALLGVKQVKTAKIITDSELVDGTVLVGRYIHDAFILDAKKYGVASIVTAASTSAGTGTGTSTK